MALLDAFGPQPGSIFDLAAAEDPDQAERRLAAYFDARDRFIRAGVGVEQTDDVLRLDRTLRGPLLDVVRVSPDFSAAYNPLLAMAYRLHRVDPMSAESLLRELELANPTRAEVRQLRLRWNRD